MLAKIIFASAMIVNVFTTGCVDPIEDDTGTVTRAIIGPGPDGHSETIYETISVAQQQAEVAARNSFTVSSKGEDGRLGLIATKGCGFSNDSLWLFDQPNLTGNQLCISKDFVNELFNLSTVPRSIFFPFTWAFAVRSLWAGIDDGFLLNCDFTNQSCGTIFHLSFAPFQRFNDISDIGTKFNAVDIP